MIFLIFVIVVYVVINFLLFIYFDKNMDDDLFSLFTSHILQLKFLHMKTGLKDFFVVIFSKG